MGLLTRISLSSSNRSPIILSATLVILFSILLTITPSFAEEKKDIIDSPIRITSDKMTAEKGSSSVEFIGNVQAIQEDSILLADSMKVFFAADKKKNKKDDAQGNITKIISTGNVKYTSGERKAFADEAVYTTSDDVLVLKGNAPRLVTGSSFVTGKKITYYRKQDKVVVESDGQKRVEALLNPEDNPGKKQ